MRRPTVPDWPTPIPPARRAALLAEGRCGRDLVADRLRELADEVGQSGDAAGRLRGLAMLANLTTELQTQMVCELRADGASWTEVADVLGVSRQAARQRFGG